ncbi:type II secretion system F family protein [Candidatus Microgenomates bacterium]|nr:type II secretion system F family protein [Candidatus Microgenomates bacterium]
MITYVYTAKNSLTGEAIKAEVQADSEKSAARLLISQSLVPITIEPKEKTSKLFGALTHRVKAKETILFTRQLATLINAGLPLAQSLRTVQEQITNQALLTIINQILADVEGGSSLSAAFAKHPKVFNDIYVNLIAAGEASGSLDKSLIRIADQLEKDHALISKLRSAMIYPIIVLLVIVSVLLFMLTSVLPQVAQLYADLGKDLPVLTAILISIANFVRGFWWLLLILIIGGGVALYRYFKTEAGRQVADRVKLRIPLFGKLFKKLYMARFCRTASVLLGSGLPMLEMLRIVKKAINNVHIEEAVERASDKVKGGKALSLALEPEPTFLSLVPQMLKIGEQSGTIDTMMDKTAQFYEDELDTATKNISTTLEPILMVALGITVGIIVAAILLPVYGLINFDNLGGAN